MTELARCNGSVLVEDGDRVGVVERGGGWLGTALFVIVLLGVISGIAGVVLLVTLDPIVGVVLLSMSATDVVATVLLLRRKRGLARGALPPPWLVFDRSAKVVRDKSGAQLCTFAELRIERVFQAGSSSKALAVFCPKKVVVARGTPFGDEVDGIEAALKRAVT